VIETNKTINLLNALRLTNTNAPATNVTKVAVASARWGEAPDEPGQKGKSVITAAREDARPTIATTNTTVELPKISIGAVVITNTAVSFTDRSLKPNVNMAIEQVNGTISKLSSEQLQHADLNLSAKVDGVGPVAITGTINPFSGTQTNDVKISVKDVDLTPASPYSGKFAGYRIA